MSKTLSVSQAARTLGVTVKYIFDLIYGGQLPAHKVNRRWAIDAHAVEARLKAREARIAAEQTVVN